MRSKKNSPIVFFALIAVLLSFVSRYATEPTSAAKSTVPAPEERLVIIVNKSNPVSNLSSAELRQIFLGEARSWANGRRVAIVMRDVGQPERDSVLRQIYRMNENDFTRHFLQAVYNGLVPSPPKALATGEGVKKFVFNVPGAIGYVRASELDDTVKLVRIDGLSPKDAGYKLKSAGR